jgi:phage terminase large subunit GpA-like protein
VYVKVSESARNEALDCRVYATAARAILNPNFEKLSRNALRKTEKAEENAAPEADSPDQEIIESAPKKKKRIIVKNKIRAGKGGNFATDW